jgi:hypothetical protein
MTHHINYTSETNERSEKMLDQSIAGKIDTGDFGKQDLWELWLLDEGENVPCSSIRTFLHYLCSASTKHCEILNTSTVETGCADIALTGPLADDEQNHLLRYQLDRGNVGSLNEAEKDLLVSKLVEQCPLEEGRSSQKVQLACRAVGVSLS